MDDIIDVNTMFGPLPVSSNDLNIDVLLEAMHANGVSHACTLSTLGILLDSAVGNAATRAGCSDMPGLIPVATVNPINYFGDTTTISGLNSEGFCMIRLFPATQAWPIRYAPLRSMVKPLNDTGLPLMVDVNTTGEITELSEALRDFTAPVILAAVAAPLLSEAIAVIKDRAGWHLEISRLLACGCIKAAVNATGPDRLLFGSGAPARPALGVLNTLRNSDIGDDALRAVMAGNARRILGV